MSRVLKRDAVPGVHSPVTAWGAPRAGNGEAAGVAADPEFLALQGECEALKSRLDAQAAELAELRDAAQSAFAAGEAKGREAGLREAADGEAERLARLEAGIADARDDLRQSLDGLERLAPALAAEALSGILGATDDRVSLVAAIVRRQLALIESRAVVHVEVSAADFVDDEALAALEGVLGAQGPSVHASVALKSGDCRIKLKLGTLEVGVDQQWGQLRALLQEMAEPAGRAA